MTFTGSLAWSFTESRAFLFRESRPSCLAAVSKPAGLLETRNHEIAAKSAWAGGLVHSLAVRGGGGNVKEVATLAELETILESSGNTIVCIDFTATWCSPCQQIAPAFEQLSMDLANVVFLKVDVDENEETAQKYDVAQMPTFILIRNGEIVDQFSGANAAVLRQKLEGLVASDDVGVFVPPAVDEEMSAGEGQADAIADGADVVEAEIVAEARNKEESETEQTTDD